MLNLDPQQRKRLSVLGAIAVVCSGVLLWRMLTPDAGAPETRSAQNAEDALAAEYQRIAEEEGEEPEEPMEEPPEPPTRAPVKRGD